MARSRNSSKPDLPPVFTDRCLGDHDVPEGLRAAGFEVRTMHEEYGPAVAQQLDDGQWIPEMAAKNYVLLSKDKGIRTTHRGVVVAAAARVYLLPDQGMRGRDMADRYVRHRYRIAARCRKDGPHIYMVGPKKLEPFKLATLGVPAGLGSPSR